MVKADRELVKDVRKIEAADLDGCDCVMHLAAISNDPMGDLNAQLTFDVNRDASIRLAEIAKRGRRAALPVRRQLLGLRPGREARPRRGRPAQSADRLRPVQDRDRGRPSPQLADDSFTPVFLRNATAYGHSPMLRIDLVVNNLLGSAMAYGEIRIQSDGSPWRPLIHCRDIARAFIALAKAPRAAVHNKAINVGANTENYQVRDVGDQVQRLIPSAKIAYTGEVGADPRNYRVKFDLLYRLLPDFRLQYNLATGMEELHRKMVEHGFGKDDFEGDQFVRLRTLKDRFDRLG